MFELMHTKKEEDEFVLQIAHSLASLLACQATRTLLLQSTEVSPAEYALEQTQISYLPRFCDTAHNGDVISLNMYIIPSCSIETRCPAYI